MVALNGREYSCPSSWSGEDGKEPMKTRHYQRIIKEWDQELPVADRDYFKLFSILTDTAFDGFFNTLENQVKIEAAVAWVVLENFHFAKKFPDSLEIGGKQIALPKKLKSLSIGANIHARQVLDKSLVLVDAQGKLVNCNCYSMLVAIYLQPQVRPHAKGGFNMSLAEELEKEIAELPIYLVQPIGFFLLKSVYEYGQKRGNSLRQILTSPGKTFRKMLPGWLKSSVFSSTVIYR